MHQSTGLCGQRAAGVKITKDQVAAIQNITHKRFGILLQYELLLDYIRKLRLMYSTKYIRTGCSGCQQYRKNFTFDQETLVSILQQ